MAENEKPVKSEFCESIEKGRTTHFATRPLPPCAVRLDTTKPLDKQRFCQHSGITTPRAPPFLRGEATRGYASASPGPRTPTEKSYSRLRPPQVVRI